MLAVFVSELRILGCSNLQFLMVKIMLNSFFCRGNLDVCRFFNPVTDKPMCANSRFLRNAIHDGDLMVG